MISVIIPCHNQAQYLRGAVESVLVQSRGDHEILIVDDGSTDGTREVANAIIAENPRRIINLLLQDQGGLSSARNAAIKASSGEYILPLDADDILNPNCLGEMAAVLDSEQADVVAADRLNFGLHCEIVRANIFCLEVGVLYNLVGYCSMFRRKCWDDAGGYPINYPQMGYEDWEFWIRCAKSGARFQAIHQVLWNYRVRQNSMARSALQDNDFLMSRIVLNNPELYSDESVARARKVYDARMEE